MRSSVSLAVGAETGAPRSRCAGAPPSYEPRRSGHCEERVQRLKRDPDDKQRAFSSSRETASTVAAPQGSPPGIGMD